MSESVLRLLFKLQAYFITLFNLGSLLDGHLEVSSGAAAGKQPFFFKVNTCLREAFQRYLLRSLVLFQNVSQSKGHFRTTHTNQGE